MRWMAGMLKTLMAWSWGFWAGKGMSEEYLVPHMMAGGDSGGSRYQKGVPCPALTRAYPLQLQALIRLLGLLVLYSGRPGHINYRRGSLLLYRHPNHPVFCPYLNQTHLSDC